VIVGVTGGIGAGKSSVCRIFEAEGALAIDADAVGHETLEDPAVRRDLAEAFGEDVLDGFGRLVRREVARRAFESEASHARLNAIVWPRIGARLRARAEEALRDRPGRPVVIDAAMLVEWGDPDGLCDFTIVVTAPASVRKVRTIARLGLTESEVEARMASQLPDEVRVQAADYVIDNDGSPEDLGERARAVWRQVLGRSLGTGPGAGLRDAEQ
jgi:dephospho-CoA kinase